MNAFSQYALFVVESLTIVMAILLTVAGIIALSAKSSDKKKIIINSLNEKLSKERHRLLGKIMSKKDYKSLIKREKKEKKSQELETTVFVIPFTGDISASQVNFLRETVDLVLSVIQPNDEVVVKIESGGGTVNGYGLAAAQLQRFRNNNTSLTVCIDKIAASGGYLMAAVANKIIAAPFAIIGSIGVVAQLPNFNRFLKKHSVDIELITAGKHKRTLTLLGENSDEGREKFTENLQDIHLAFKQNIKTHRPTVDLDEVATGDYWLGGQAYTLKLVDEIKTSDEYLSSAIAKSKVFELSEDIKVSKLKKLIEGSFSKFYYK